jgi:hypothetical protein
MKSFKYAFAALALAVATPAFAQGWINYVNETDWFSVNLPGEPSLEESVTISQRGDPMPTRIYRVDDEHGGRYIVTVYDYANAEVSDVRSSISWEAWKVRKDLPEGDEITFDGYAQIDRIEGHQIQISRADGSKTYYAWHLHLRKLYQLEATVPAGQPVPAAFQASLWILNPETRENYRYTIDADGQRISDDQ